MLTLKTSHVRVLSIDERELVTSGSPDDVRRCSGISGQYVLDMTLGCALCQRVSSRPIFLHFVNLLLDLGPRDIFVCLQLFLANLGHAMTSYKVVHHIV